VDDVRRAYAEAIRTGRGRRARYVLEDALSVGRPLPELFREVVRPVLRELGDEAVDVTENVVSGLGPQMRVGPNARPAVVVHGPGDVELLAARIAADLLGAEGWETIVCSQAERDGVVEAEQPDRVVEPPHW
jgi:hypothetical protein